MLKRGFVVNDSEGAVVRFGPELKDKLDRQSDGNNRKEVLLWAREAVRRGEKKIQMQNGEERVIYGKVFRESEKDKGVLVIVDAEDSYAFNLYQIRPEGLAKKLRNRERLESGEQPPVEVLEAFAPLLTASHEFLVYD